MNCRSILLHLFQKLTVKRADHNPVRVTGLYDRIGSQPNEKLMVSADGLHLQIQYLEIQLFRHFKEFL